MAGSLALYEQALNTTSLLVVDFLQHGAIALHRGFPALVLQRVVASDEALAVAGFDLASVLRGRHAVGVADDLDVRSQLLQRFDIGDDAFAERSRHFGVGALWSVPSRLKSPLNIGSPTPSMNTYSTSGMFFSSVS